jgi:hypothetical protein
MARAGPGEQRVRRSLHFADTEALRWRQQHDTDSSSSSSSSVLQSEHAERLLKAGAAIQDKPCLTQHAARDVAAAIAAAQRASGCGASAPVASGPIAGASAVISDVPVRQRRRRPTTASKDVAHGASPLQDQQQGRQLVSCMASAQPRRRRRSTASQGVTRTDASGSSGPPSSSSHSSRPITGARKRGR